MHLSASFCRKWSFATCDCFRTPTPRQIPTPACGPACTNTAATVTPLYRGTIDGLRKIVASEGMRVLWRGTDVALMMAIPMVGIYLPLYDYLLLQLHEQRHTNAATPLIAGTLARTVAVYCTAPFELLRTRLQAHSPAAAAAAPAVAGEQLAGYCWACRLMGNVEQICLMECLCLAGTRHRDAFTSSTAAALPAVPPAQMSRGAAAVELPCCCSTCPAALTRGAAACVRQAGCGGVWAPPWQGMCPSLRCTGAWWSRFAAPCCQRRMLAAVLPSGRCSVPTSQVRLAGVLGPAGCSAVEVVTGVLVLGVAGLA
jgi:hypothetical protein